MLAPHPRPTRLGQAGFLFWQTFCRRGRAHLQNPCVFHVFVKSNGGWATFEVQWGGYQIHIHVYLMLCRNAPGAEIGFPGQISPGF